MRLSKLLYLASRTTRDVEVVTGPEGPERLVKRLIRRVVTRRVGRGWDRVWR
jgi:hypothetical protein